MLRNCLRIVLPLLAYLFLPHLTLAQKAAGFKHASNSNSAIEKWRPVILTDVTQINITAPPNASETAREIEEVKKKSAALTEKLGQEILYWDAGSPAYRWNELVCKMANFENIKAFFRFPGSWMNLAIYDATLVAWKAKYLYNRQRPFETDGTIRPLIAAPSTPSYPCEHSVTAAAAATVLAYFFPQQADSILRLARSAAESRINAGLQYPSDVKEGWRIGELVALKTIEKAKMDGADTPFKGQMPSKETLWRGDYPVGIHVKNHKPFVLTSGDQFRPAPPPDFAKDMKELKEFKRNINSDAIALRWAALSGIDIWTELASKKIFENRIDRNTPECARIYALLHTVIYDVSIAIMDAKYAYWGIRPDQYDKNFKPLITTPPFPGYPSGHATSSSACATVLSHLFPADKELFRTIAQECSDSRFFAGIHFRTDNETGIQVGEKVANYIINQWIMKIGKG
ncbi:MAG TPA: phosphatase PAP2 family protein [Chitinophagaceae bacterium]